MITWGTLLILLAAIAGLLAWVIISDIKKTEAEKRQKKIMIYSSLILCSVVLYISLVTFGQGLMDKLFYMLGGQVRFN